MELINKIRKSRKGFTLVEIIVVLVILAVLAAFTIPSMLGFVAEAKKKAAIAEQREVYVAAQAIATEYYAKKTAADAATALGVSSGVAVNLGSNIIALADDATKVAALPDAAKEMKNYMGTDITAAVTGATSGSVWTVEIDANGKVTKVTYTRDNVKLDDLLPSAKF